TQVTFNDVRSEVIPLMVDGLGLPRAPSEVRMFPHLHSEEGIPPNIDCRMPGWPGPRFEPAGEGRGRWHDLTVTVTPSGVVAEWDGQPFEVPGAEIAPRVAREIARMRPRYPGDPFVQNLQPQFVVRGGLGLYLLRGSASFAAVTVTPLGDAD